MAEMPDGDMVEFDRGCWTSIAPDNSSTAGSKIHSRLVCATARPNTWNRTPIETIGAMTLPWYLSRVHRVDHDRDGRSDLVFWHETHFDVHYQDAEGSFGANPGTFTVPVPFDSDGLYSHVFGYEGEAADFISKGGPAADKISRVDVETF